MTRDDNITWGETADELDRLRAELSEERHAHNKTQFDLAQARKEPEQLRKAAIDLRDDMLMRAKMHAHLRGGDVVVEAGNGVWQRFNAAIERGEHRSKSDDN